MYAQHGMARRLSPSKSIAIDILKIGGSAVDAAIAANAAPGLMEPTGNGIGGDLCHALGSCCGEACRFKRIRRSPKSRTFAQLKSQLNGADTIPPICPSQCLASRCKIELHNRYGKPPISQVLAPAIRYKGGVPISPVIGLF